MKLLTLGTGNQKKNKAAAVRFVAENLIDSAAFDESSGELSSATGRTYTVSAYAETVSAFVKTPGVSNSKNSIYASGNKVIMVYQQKSGKIVVYLLDPTLITPPKGSSSVPWPKISAASETKWICVGKEVKRFGPDPNEESD